MKQELAINWEEVISAFESRMEGMDPYLDLESGDVRYHFSDAWDDPGEELGSLTEEEIEQHGGRYIYIEVPESHETFRWMADFAHEQQDDRVREALWRALSKKRPFRRFKDALCYYPATREAWFAYEHKRFNAAITEWAASLPVIIANPPAWFETDEDSNQE